VGQGKRIIPIFLADGNALFRSGLRAVFSAENGFQILGEACSAAETLARLTGASNTMIPQVVIMDLALLEAEGQQLAFALRQAHPSLALLFLTREDSPEHLQLAIAAGARGYMLKDSKPAQLIAAVREAANGLDDRNPSGLSQIVPDLQALAKTNEGYARAVLTNREQEVMKLLAEGRTVREVASELSLSIKTIEAHKLNLMRKLDIHNRATLVEYAIQRGLVPAQV